MAFRWLALCIALGVTTAGASACTRSEPAAPLPDSHANRCAGDAGCKDAAAGADAGEVAPGADASGAAPGADAGELAPDAQASSPDASGANDAGADAAAGDAGEFDPCPIVTVDRGFAPEPRAWCAIYLKPERPGAGDRFGSSVAMTNDLLVVGAPLEDSAASDSGAVYVFVRSGERYEQRHFLKASTASAGARFGASLALHGDTLVVGAPGADGSGAAVVFVRDGEGWTEQALLTASNAGEGDAFGASVAVFGDRVVVGAPFEDGSGRGLDPADDDDAADSGAAYAFVRDGTRWEPAAKLKGSHGEPGDRFGTSVALSAAHLVVGAPGEDSAYAYSAASFAEQAYLEMGPYSFGYSAALDGDDLVLGGPEEPAPWPGPTDGYSQFGFVRAYAFVDGSWQRVMVDFPLGQDDYQHVGASVAIAGDLMVAGGPGNYTLEEPADWGTAAGGRLKVFVRVDGEWDSPHDLLELRSAFDSNDRPHDQFGFSVAVFDGRIAAGAPGEDGASSGTTPDPLALGLEDSGAVYLLHRYRSP